MIISRLTDVLNSLRNGSLKKITIENSAFINDLTMNILSTEKHSVDQIAQMGLIINISNILYNNTDREILPLEDGVYDILLSLYKKYNPMYQVGAEPITFESSNAILEKSTKLINPVRHFSDKSKFLFLDDLNKRPELSRADYLIRPVFNRDMTSMKKVVNTPHVYPKLVGTLEKCKFALNSQAIERGVFDDTNVQVFERDFIQAHIESGILNPARKFYMVAELKYDGVSVEGEVSNKIISARSRGDTNNDLAADLTPIFSGYRFPRANEIPEDNVFGMKFEAIITYDNLYRLSKNTGKVYKNARNAIIGILGSLDAYMYRDYITLVPLATSMEDVDRLTEIQFMNKYYNSGEFLRYSLLYGDYKEILFQVKKFVEEAEYMRGFLPFMYDGVVLSYIEPDLIDTLGRANSINHYSIAIKFNAMKKQTVFLGYNYTVGQNGVVTPMIHYNPVEFYGTIHNKSTGHSYKRFKELGLRQGDIISVEYTNDVMPYVTKPDLEANDLNQNEPIEFIKVCPSCGNTLKESDSGKSMVCDNIRCPERNISRMVNMLQKLNLKDFSEETLKTLAKFSLTELLSLKEEDIKFIGEVNALKFISRMDQLREIPIYDYKIIGALGFSSIAAEKWKLILNEIDLDSIILVNEDALRNALVSIKGIGPIAADTICTEREFFMQDLKTIISMPNVICSKGMRSKKSIRFSGIRDKALVEQLTAMGLDANDEAGVTKNTDILIIPHESYTSTKTAKAGEGTTIVTHDEFVNNMNKYV